jgi:succinate dehydrogenase / fumarate reductase cytochrome b subunit
LLVPLFPESGVLWILRGLLVSALIVHVCSAALLWTRGRAARGKFKAKRNNGFRSLQATLMPISGVIIVCYLVFHILGLTLGVAPFASAEFQHSSGDTFFAYQNLVADFSRTWSALVYVFVMILLALHISHGIATLASDLGAIGRRWRAIFVIISGVVAVFVMLGNASIPISVLAGWLS